jgi:hypothetical protein
MRRIAAVSLVFWTLLTAVSVAQLPANTTVPNLVRYSGVLRDGQGAAISSTTVGVTFAIYKQQDGGAPIWMETQNVTTDAGGNYSVLLGSTTAAGLPSDLFLQQEQRWLGVQVQGQPEQPCVMLVSVPYAFKAHEAETLGGKSVSDFVLAAGVNSTANGTSHTSQATPTANNNSRGKQGPQGAASAGPTNFSGSTTDQIVGVTQSGGGAGINAMASSNTVVATATASAGRAVRGIAAGGSGEGVVGEATFTHGSGVGVKGSSSSTRGTGVRGIAIATSGITRGVSAYVNSPSGIAGVFDNAANGEIISGQTQGFERFSVDGSGNVNVYGSYKIGEVVTLSANNGLDDLFVGGLAGERNTAGAYDVFAGYSAGLFNTSGRYNTFTGYAAGLNNTTGEFNTFYGYQAGYENLTGSYNLELGYYAGGRSNSGSNNIYLGYEGPLTGSESYTLRLGTAYNNGPCEYQPGPCGQNVTYIAGIFGSVVDAQGVPVYVDDKGQMGTVVSSRRFEEGVKDMGDHSETMMKLRPVTFFNKSQGDQSERGRQYGLIAEEVAQVYPELVAYDKDGQPYSVRYQYLSTMLLNEVQKQYRRAEAEAKVISTQQDEIRTLQEQNHEFQERLLRLERLIPQTAAKK